MAPMPFVSRVLLAWGLWFRILLDGALAGRLDRASRSLPEPEPEPAAVREDTSALELLALLQREGRFVDFVEQDVDTFSDADVGAAARVVHEGCRRALRAHGTFAPVRAEEEGAKVTLEVGFDASRVALVGNVSGSPPFSGIVKHRGWEVRGFALPEPAEGRDPAVVAAAEVEL